MVEYIRTYLRLKHDERAVTAVEYALIAGLIAVVIITSVTLVGTSLTGLFNKIATNVSSV